MPWTHMPKLRSSSMHSNPFRSNTSVSKFQEVRSLVAQRVALEENEMFPKAEQIMTPQEAEELSVFVERAQQAIKRHAPTTEGGTPEEIRL